MGWNSKTQHPALAPASQTCYFMFVQPYTTTFKLLPALLDFTYPHCLPKPNSHNTCFIKVPSWRLRNSLYVSGFQQVQVSPALVTGLLFTAGKLCFLCCRMLKQTYGGKKRHHRLKGQTSVCWSSAVKTQALCELGLFGAWNVFSPYA